MSKRLKHKLFGLLSAQFMWKVITINDSSV